MCEGAGSASRRHRRRRPAHSSEAGSAVSWASPWHRWRLPTHPPPPRPTHPPARRQRPHSPPGVHVCGPRQETAVACLLAPRVRTAAGRLRVWAPACCRPQVPRASRRRRLDLPPARTDVQDQPQVQPQAQRGWGGLRGQAGLQGLCPPRPPGAASTLWRPTVWSPVGPWARLKEIPEPERPAGLRGPRALLPQEGGEQSEAHRLGGRAWGRGAWRSGFASHC